MRRIIVAAVVLAAVTVATDYWWVRGFQHWLGIHTGDLNEPGPFYGFWSGFGSVVIPPILQGLTFGVVFVWHQNCHTQGCWRIGRHQVGGRKWCHRHHQTARDAETARPDPLLVAVLELGGKYDRNTEALIGLADAIRLSLVPHPSTEGNQP